jgi:hypothetical protein
VLTTDINLLTEASFDVPIDGFDSIDLSEYALKIKSIFFVNLPTASEFSKFGEKEFVYDPSDFDSFGKTNYYEVPPAHPGPDVYPADPTNVQNEFIFSDSKISAVDFSRAVIDSLSAAGIRSTQGLFGLSIACEPFKTKKIYYGGDLAGRITLVNRMIDFLDNQEGANFIDAVTSDMEFPVPPEIIVVPESTLLNSSSQSSAAALLSILSPGLVGTNYYILKESQIFKKPSVVFDLSDPSSTATIGSHQAYLADYALNLKEKGRGNPRGQGPISHVDNGGYYLIVMSDVLIDLKLAGFIHELSHCLTPDLENYQGFNAHMDPRGGNDENFSDVTKAYKKWRGFGDGTTASFDGFHPSPSIKTVNRFHSCPLVYLVNEKICPMPSTDILSYSSRRVITAGSLYYGASYLGANPIRTDLPTEGEVFKHEAFCSLVDEHASPDGDNRSNIPNNDDVFLMFNADRFVGNFRLAQITKSFFLKLQILWGGIEGDNSSFLTKPNSSDRDQLVQLFETTEIQYDDFSYTQKDEYKINYADEAVESNNPGGSLDFFKRASNYNSNEHTFTEANRNTEIVYSHVHDDVLEAMGFEILEDVIEVINGQPRKTSSGDIAKYNYIVSKARAHTASALENSFETSFPEGDGDAKISSLWGGFKVAQNMAIKNDQGKEECKYVYIVARNASNLNFQSASLSDDRGKSLMIL